MQDLEDGAEQREDTADETRTQSKKPIKQPTVQKRALQCGAIKETAAKKASHDKNSADSGS
jgi:hypothetical protein